MGFGVFVHRADSIYQDQLVEQYQFPREGRLLFLQAGGHPRFLEWHRANCFKQ